MRRPVGGRDRLRWVDAGFRTNDASILTDHPRAIRTAPAAESGRVRGTGRQAAVKAVAWLTQDARKVAEVPMILERTRYGELETRR